MPSRLLALARQHPSAVLLLVQLAGVVGYALLEDTPAGRALFGVFGLLVLGAALWMVRRTPALTWIAAVLALPAMVLSMAQAVAPRPELVAGAAALEAVFYLYAAGSLIAYMLQDHRATTDELFAAGATFTLLAWAFAYAYVACQHVAPGSFTGMVSPGEPRTWMELLFLSFSTLSGVGLGDILPLTPIARALVMIEELTGVMYIAAVVSRLVGLTLTRVS